MRRQPTGQPPTYTNLRDSIKVLSNGLRFKPGSTCDSRSPDGDGPAGRSPATPPLALLAPHGLDKAGPPQDARPRRTGTAAAAADPSRAGLYTVRVLEVAGEDHRLLDAEDYRAAIASN